MISNHISDDIPPRLEILKMAIPIIMHTSACLPLKSLFLSQNGGLQVACHLTKWNVTKSYCRKKTWEGKTVDDIFFNGWLVLKVFKLYGSLVSDQI